MGVNTGRIDQSRARKVSEDIHRGVPINFERLNLQQLSLLTMCLVLERFLDFTTVIINV